MRPLCSLMLLLSVICSPILHAEGKSESPVNLTFGIVPQQSAKKLAKAWTPILQYLSRETGVNIAFRTAPNIPVFEQRLAAGEYDLAYMNPYHYTVFREQPGYIAIAKQKNKKIQGIVVVKADSKIQSLAELKGQTLAFPSPAAFAATILPQANMRKDKIDFTAEYVSSHDSVYLSVAQGLFVAGGGVKRTFNSMAPEIRDQLRILWTTPAYTPHAIASHPRVSHEIRTKIIHAMITMDGNSEGASLLKTINFEALIAPEPVDWEDVKNLNIQLLSHMLSEAP